MAPMWPALRAVRPCVRPASAKPVNWFRQRIAVTLQRAQARAIHARMARLEATPSLLSSLPARAVISAGDLLAIVGSS